MSTSLHSGKRIANKAGEYPLPGGDDSRGERSDRHDVDARPDRERV